VTRKCLKIQVDIPFLGTGIEVGDVIDAIQKALEPVKQEAYSNDVAVENMVQSGDIINENDGDELIGFWEIADRR
jgi:hypothetical protein